MLLIHSYFVFFCPYLSNNAFPFQWPVQSVMKDQTEMKVRTHLCDSLTPLSSCIFSSDKQLLLMGHEKMWKPDNFLQYQVKQVHHAIHYYMFSESYNKIFCKNKENIVVSPKRILLSLNIPFLTAKIENKIKH